MSTLLRVLLSHKCQRKTSITLLQARNFNFRKTKHKISSYFLNKYLAFVKRYEPILEKRFPAAVRIYRVFSIGIQEFRKDVFLLYQIHKKYNSGGYKALTRKEMEIYFQIPRDMIRVAPVLLVSALPLGGVMFPIAYMFPKKLLTSHFWSLQQRSEFAMIDHKKRLHLYRPAFRCLQAQLKSIEDETLQETMAEVLGLLGSGVHPSVELILQCKPLFEGKPYHLSSLESSHIRSLLKLHNMHRFWSRRKRLKIRAVLTHNMDLAMIREGGIEKLTQEEIKLACFKRGLNPINMRNEDIYEWLNCWLEVSKNIDSNSASLLLHCPILLAYNQPSNWALLHDNRTR